MASISRKPLVLIVDDEPAIRTVLHDILTAQGFVTEQTGTGEGATLLAVSLNADLVLLDLGLPDRDGKDVVRILRQTVQTPIIVLSARNQEAEKVAALEAGADDYLTKPFGGDELVARIKVALRHSSRIMKPTGAITIGSLTWNADLQQLMRDGSQVHLTPLESRLFQFLVANPGRVLTYGTLLRDVWGVSNLAQSQIVRVAMASLRKKLGDGENGVSYISTEVGTGYRFWAE